MWYGLGVSEDLQLLLPVEAWDEGAMLRAQGGKRLQRWGSVQMARKMLWGYGKDKIYLMIEAGEIFAVKGGAGRTASWRVDLVSVWEHKVRAEAAARARF